MGTRSGVILRFGLGLVDSIRTWRRTPIGFRDKRAPQVEFLISAEKFVPTHQTQYPAA
jgi:hypothetical protein